MYAIDYARQSPRPCKFNEQYWYTADSHRRVIEPSFFFSNLSVRYSTLRRKIKRNIVSRVILSTVKSSPVLLIAFFFYEEEQGRCSSFLLGELEGWIDKIARKLLSMIALKRSSPFEPYFGCFVPWSLPRIKNFQDYSRFFIKENVLLNRKSQVVVIL